LFFIETHEIIFNIALYDAVLNGGDLTLLSEDSQQILDSFGTIKKCRFNHLHNF
jgi:hypothetical protein